MKYIDAELLRKEIERLKEEYNEQVSAGLISESLVSMGKVEALNKVLAFIESLQQEQPDADLEKAAEKSARQYYVDGGYSPFPNIETASHIAGFKAGAEWMKRKMMEGATYNELMELYRAIRDELVKRHCDVPVNIKEEQ